MASNGDDQTHSVINVDEFIGKTVGRRKPPAPFTSKMLNRKAMIHAREVFGGIRIPRGVHRFESHEEADLWLIKKIAQAAAARS
jgi:hypothetical protein